MEGKIKNPRTGLQDQSDRKRKCENRQNLSPEEGVGRSACRQFAECTGVISLDRILRIVMDAIRSNSFPEVMLGTGFRE